MEVGLRIGILTMNDFTKDELKQICQFFNIAIEDFQEPESTYDLRDKIQSMIDNYCEHEWHPGEIVLGFIVLNARRTLIMNHIQTKSD